MSPNQPKRVVSIVGEHKSDQITQVELAEVSDLQAAEWMAAHAAHRAVMTLVARIQLGAEVERGLLEFDADLGMVRTRKQPAKAERRARKKEDVG